MYDFSVIMALVDFIPVICFAISGILLMRDFYYRMPRYGFAMLAAGTINVFIAGFLKAVWKLLYAANICDFQALNTLFLPTQSIGFMVVGIALIIHVTRKRNCLYVVGAPPVFKGTFLFLGMMVLGLGCMCLSLSMESTRYKRKRAIPFFLFSFLFSMGMGYAGRLDGTAAWVNWFEQVINIASQGCMMIGVIMLHKVTSGSEKAQHPVLS